MSNINGGRIAQVISNGFVGFRDFDLRSAYGQFDNFAFFDSVNFSVESTRIPGFVGTYSAEDQAAFWSGATRFENTPTRFVMGGKDVVVDANDHAVAGRITRMFFQIDKAGKAAHFAIAGFRIDAVSFQAAAVSQLTSGDISVRKKAFSGDDRANGSEFSDYAFGGSGSDKLFDNNRNDAHFGNAGKDRITGDEGSVLTIMGVTKLELEDQFQSL